ncbi:hypothetical protein SAMN05216257_10499 [Meinhardsimonia xiamenensis]|jgi:hypothetical protein|uniref:Uncharacterized protein n=1 Tax=Meinhardsimonia xiamenensis TaxID=990712 RepID=A0A1G9E0I9_9RHOB|nr:hypothetical protein [Meinhardsimonia xiamenensis]PRX29018.1 hypothetical protein LV81_02962 [Meinhardsimonia xiamenensis]SDK69598.1 hypothetical protein SAMN05216257_10499 [Meinhardsimonia xiamenensis]
MIANRRRSAIPAMTTAEKAKLLSGPALIDLATGRSNWWRAIALAELRERIATGDVNDIDHDAAEALGLI